MLTEFLHSSNREEIMPGICVCKFSLHQPEEGFPVSLPLKLDPMHFEAFFCSEGSLLFGSSSHAPTSIGAQEILLLSDVRSLSSAQITAPLNGICLSVDASAAHESLANLQLLVGNIKLYMQDVHALMDEHNGIMRIQASPWTRTAFTALSSLSFNDQARYCTMKCIELLYLLCNHSSLLNESALTSGYLANTVSEIQTYMENHLDENLTIPSLSQRFNISPTAFKSCFRNLYGMPVHTWLQARRMHRAAEFLIASPMTVLQVAQSVGYDGVSQFNVVFKRRYGMTPSQYRKMSNSVNFKPLL